MADTNATTDPVKEVTIATFMADVIDASRDRLVIVDFWAPWCGPCKQLGPALEKIVRAQKGAARLAKINIDRNPEIAQQMRVQSIPAVFAFFRGQPVDGFMGALPESQLKAWIDKLVKAVGSAPTSGNDTASALKQAEEFLAAGDASTAQAIYEHVLSEAPDTISAMAGLLRTMIVSGQTEDAQKRFDQLPPERTSDKAFDGIRAALELAQQTPATGSLDELHKKVQANPDDHQARFDLAMAAYASGQRESAVDELLEIVRRDRKWNDDGARKQLVKLFEAIGPTDSLTVDARKRLSAILFA